MAFSEANFGGGRVGEGYNRYSGFLPSLLVNGFGQ